MAKNPYFVGFYRNFVIVKKIHFKFILIKWTNMKREKSGKKMEHEKSLKIY